jgi:hypothetical protein
VHSGTCACRAVFQRSASMVSQLKRKSLGRVQAEFMLLVTAAVHLASGTPVGAADRISFEDKLQFGPGAQNHPMNIRPSSAVSIPGGWPLAADGTLKCTTCHERLPSIDGTGEPMLRVSRSSRGSTSEFCLNCHGNAEIGTRRSMHFLAMEKAHVLPIDDEGARTGSQLDSESRRCLSCHDGVTASEHVNGPAASSVGLFVERGQAHPVGISYGSSGGHQAKTPLRHRNLIPHEVRLPGGVVSCVSCHDIYQASPNLLSLPIEGSKLFFSCHEMD